MNPNTDTLPLAIRRKADGLRKASEAEQITFFTALYGTPTNTGYTVERWESIPKFRLAHLRYQKEPEAWETSFTLDDVKTLVSIEPGLVNRGNSGKKRVGVIPGVREELVWRVLLEMAAEQQRERGIAEGAQNRLKNPNGVKQLNAYVFFSLDELRRRLEERGKAYKISEVREALIVLNNAKIVIAGRALWPNDPSVTDDTTPLSYIAELYFKGQKLPDGTVAHRCLALLNSFATQMILQLRCFPIDNQAVMSLRLPLSRWILTRISHRFRQADSVGSFMKQSGYNISLSTILNESGIQNEKRQRAVIERIREALDELHQEKHLQEHGPYKEAIVYAPAQGRGRPPVADIVWTLYPSYDLVEKIINGNVFIADRKKELMQRQREQIGGLKGDNRALTAGFGGR